MKWKKKSWEEEGVEALSIGCFDVNLNGIKLQLKKNELK